MAGFDLPGSLLVANLWWYGFAVLRPAQMMRPLGLYRGRTIGVQPGRAAAKGAGPFYSRRHRKPVYLRRKPAAYDLVEDFDQISAEYDQVIEPFSRPIVEETLRVMQ